MVRWWRRAAVPTALSLAAEGTDEADAEAGTSHGEGGEFVR